MSGHGPPCAALAAGPAARYGDPHMSRFASHPWRIVEEGWDPADRAGHESIFALANGTLGLRGNVEEGAGVAVRGTYVNGFYESAPIVYGEGAHAFARNHQVMLNVVDGKRI